LSRKTTLPSTGSLRNWQPSRLLGFYQGFPIFDGSTGFAKLQSRLGIHIDPEAVMISTPLDKYEDDVYELAESLARETGLDYSQKKNRVIFPKDDKLLQVLVPRKLSACTKNKKIKSEKSMQRPVGE